MFQRDPLANPKPLIRRVYAYVAYRIGDGPDAEDVTSATFERALRYRDSFDPKRGSAAAWLIGIAARCVADNLVSRPVFAELVDVASTYDLEEETVRRLTLDSALARLSVGDRDLLALRYGADLTARQIAGLRGSNRNAVAIALHRALARLRVAMEPSPAPQQKLLAEARL
jgi:RNA polymerase sigma-70 factor (ECF subfamily)